MELVSNVFYQVASEPVKPLETQVSNAKDVLHRQLMLPTLQHLLMKHFGGQRANGSPYPFTGTFSCHSSALAS